MGRKAGQSKKNTNNERLNGGIGTPIIIIYIKAMKLLPWVRRLLTKQGKWQAITEQYISKITVHGLNRV